MHMMSVHTLEKCSSTTASVEPAFPLAPLHPVFRQASLGPLSDDS